jgi:hypothetical protein
MAHDTLPGCAFHIFCVRSTGCTDPWLADDSNNLILGTADLILEISTVSSDTHDASETKWHVSVASRSPRGAFAIRDVLPSKKVSHELVKLKNNVFMRRRARWVKIQRVYDASKVLIGLLRVSPCMHHFPRQQ